LKLSRFFYIYIYHKDRDTLLKRKGNMRGVKAYGGVIKKSNGYLKPSIERMKIIITTPETFAHRHGPKGVTEWRHNRIREAWTARGRPRNDTFMKEEETYLQANFTKPDRDWKYDLSGCFSSLIMDKAQCVKSNLAIANIALRWIDTPFVALTTATPITSGHFNIIGYLALLKLPKSHKAFERALGVDPYLDHLDDIDNDRKFACLSSAT
jgi:hypothetical protein